MPLIGTVQPLPPPHQSLQVGGRPRPGELEQLALVIRCSHTGNRPHLAERQLAPGHRLRDERQTLERPSGPDLLVRRASHDADPPRKPLGTRYETLLLPVPVSIRLRESRQKRSGRGRDLSEQHSDSVHALDASIGLQCRLIYFQRLPIHLQRLSIHLQRFPIRPPHDPSQIHLWQRVTLQYNGGVWEALTGSQSAERGLPGHRATLCSAMGLSRPPTGVQRAAAPTFRTRPNALAQIRPWLDGTDLSPKPSDLVTSGLSSKSAASVPSDLSSISAASVPSDLSPNPSDPSDFVKDHRQVPKRLIN